MSEVEKSPLNDLRTSRVESLKCLISCGLIQAVLIRWELDEVCRLFCQVVTSLSGTRTEGKENSFDW